MFKEHTKESYVIRFQSTYNAHYYEYNNVVKY